MSKIILITGASSGFGRLTAEALAKAGHTVYASMRETEGCNAPQVAAISGSHALTLQRATIRTAWLNGGQRCAQNTYSLYPRPVRKGIMLHVGNWTAFDPNYVVTLAVTCH